MSRSGLKFLEQREAPGRDDGPLTVFCEKGRDLDKEPIVRAPKAVTRGVSFVVRHLVIQCATKEPRYGDNISRPSSLALLFTVSQLRLRLAMGGLYNYSSQ
jgi:hypothetical protein